MAGEGGSVGKSAKGTAERCAEEDELAEVSPDKGVFVSKEGKGSLSGC